MKNYIIAGIGELLWDVLPELEVIGGAPVNFAYHVTALGAKGIPVSTIGRDGRGKMALAELQDRGMDIAAISVSSEYETGYVEAIVNGDGMATYNFPPIVAWDKLQINDYAKNIQGDLDAICFGTLGQRSEDAHLAIHSFLNGLKGKTLKIFDINIRQDFYCQRVIESSLNQANILKLNDEELPILAEVLGLQGRTKERMKTLIDRYKLAMVILSRGGDGSILISPSCTSEHSGIVTNIVDTIGAGDSFTAAVAIGYLQGRSLNDINETANKVASYVCSQRGAMPPVPDSLRMISC